MLCPFRARRSGAAVALFYVDGQANMRHVRLVVLGVPFSFLTGMRSAGRCTNDTFSMSPKSNSGLVCGIRRLLLLLLLPGLAFGAFVFSVVAHHNFHVVSPGLVYRSAQMNADALATVIPEYGIKSILNLRGAGEGKDWYVAEINTARELEVQHFDYALSAGRELTDAEMDQILATIRSAPKPILIHCKSGSDRTGLVGALYLYSLEGQPSQSARCQLAVFYGHVPHLLWSDTIAMDNSFWRYVSNHTQQPKISSTVNRVVAPDDLSSLSAPALAH
jgi:protein tyrosine phosphatase (PTP) superfamily phosphohydrolase (DUF442 family)